MTKKEEGYKRFISSGFTPLILGIVFTLTFYGIYFGMTGELGTDITSYKVLDFAKKFGVFIPAVYGILSIIVHYIFVFVRWIIRLKCFVSSLLLVFIVYGFNLFMGIQLMFYEPRFTDVAKFIIDTYSKPILGASALTILVSFVFVFIKIKKS